MPRALLLFCPKVPLATYTLGEKRFHFHGFSSMLLCYAGRSPQPKLFNESDLGLFFYRDLFINLRFAKLICFRRRIIIACNYIVYRGTYKVAMRYPLPSQLSSPSVLYLLLVLLLLLLFFYNEINHITIYLSLLSSFVVWFKSRAVR